MIDETKGDIETMEWVLTCFFAGQALAMMKFGAQGLGDIPTTAFAVADLMTREAMKTHPARKKAKRK